jgi:polyribonucleotide nucleotidyltransferase
VVSATVVAARSATEGQDFFPLSVDYRERAYAGGRIPGGFFKREGRPAEKEILTSRLIDRPLRPLFPKGFRNEIQLIALAISSDQENDPGILAMNGASAAVLIAGVPFLGPFGAVRIGHIDGRLVVNPSFADLESSTLDLVVAATEDSVMMVEAGAREVSEDTFIEAIALAHDECRALVRTQRALAQLAGKPRWEFDASVHQDPALEAQVRAAAGGRVRDVVRIPEKAQRAQGLTKLAQEVVAAVDPEGLRKAKVREYLDKLEKQEVRRMVLEDGVRIDGRKSTDTRAISAEVSFLPRTHGSALFTRGETQALVAATLGTKQDEQRVETLEGESTKPFMLHYNFPSFSVGEIRRFGQSGAPGDRSRGARRAVGAAGPAAREGFPYTLASCSISSSQTARPRWPRCAGLAGADGRRCSDQGAGRGHRHGAHQGRRALRDPDGHHGHRGPLRRHGLQGRRHGRGHHRAPDGHQGGGCLSRDHGGRPPPGARGPAVRAVSHARGASRSRGPSCRRMPPAS